MNTKKSTPLRQSSLSGISHGTLAIYHNILGARPDGYHKFQSVLQSISVFDTVTVNISEGTGKASVKSTNRNFQTPYVADVIEDFLSLHSFNVNVSVHIESHIPVGFGLFEKEAATAKALKLINTCVGEPISRIKLLEFTNCISNELLCASVNGSKYADMLDKHKCMISSLPPIPQCGILIIHGRNRKPITYEEAIAACDRHYGGYRERRNENQKLKAMLEAVPAGSLSKITENCSNVFYDPVKSLHPDAEKAANVLLDLGAINAETVSHSSAVYGIFEDTEKARALINSKALEGYDAYFTEPI